jgi:hypothetical protein
MAQNSPNVSSTVSASLISLIVGGVIGFYVQTFMPVKPVSATASMQAPGPGGAAGRMGGAPGGFGGGFGGAPSPTGDLARLVRNLDTVQKVQGSGLTPAQTAALAPVLARVRSAATISDADAQSDADAIQKILTPAQKDALTAIQPARGGRGGGQRGGGMAGGMGGGQRPPQDPSKPFASDRNKQALDDLIARAGKS